MAQRSLLKETQVVHLLDAASNAAGTVKSSLLDTQGCDAALLLLNYGVYTVGTGTGVTWKLREGDTAADANLTDVAAADYEGSFTGVTGLADDQISVLVAYKGTKRYVGLDIVVTANSTSALLSADGIRLNLRTAPGTAPAAVTRT